MDTWLFGQLFILLPLTITANTTISSEYSPVLPKDINFRPKAWFWNVQEYPNPQETPRNCHRYQKSFVCDPDDIISIGEADALDILIQTAKDDTPCLCSKCNSTTSGVNIGIALLKNIFINYHSPPSEEIRKFAETLRKNWKLGSCDDDILILISTEDKMVYTDLGSAVTDLLQKEITTRIFLENRNHFTAGHYYQGLELMIQSYSDAIRTESEKRSSAPAKQSSLNLIVGLTVTFIILVALLAGLAFWWTKRKRGRENNQRYSWETSNSLKRGDINKVQGPYVAVRTFDNQPPAMAEKQREGYLERLNEEEELELEQLSEEGKLQSEDHGEDGNVQVNAEDEIKLPQIKDCPIQKSDDETEEYFMPRKRSETQWQPVATSSNDNIDNISV